MLNQSFYSKQKTDTFKKNYCLRTKRGILYLRMPLNYYLFIVYLLGEIGTLIGLEKSNFSHFIGETFLKNTSLYPKLFAVNKIPSSIIGNPHYLVKNQVTYLNSILRLLS